MAQEREQKSSMRNVRDVMTPNPECVKESDSLMEVARIMKSCDTGVVPVVDGKKVIGLITDRDIVVRGLAAGKNLESTKIGDLMSTSVHSVRDDVSVSDALSMMGSSEIRRIPVVNAANELVGILSLGDIAKQGTLDTKVGKAVEQISEARPNS